MTKTFNTMGFGDIVLDRLPELRLEVVMNIQVNKAVVVDVRRIRPLDSTLQARPQKTLWYICRRASVYSKPSTLQHESSEESHG